MGRVQLLYYALIIILFVSVILLLSWWGSIERELQELPATGSISDCGVVNVKVSYDSLSWVSDIDVGSNFDRLFLKITDNALRELSCPNLKYEIMLGSCKGDLCSYSNTLKTSFSDIKGEMRLDSFLFSLKNGEYAIKLRQSDTYYAWSSPIFISVDANDQVKEEMVDLSSYLVYEQGDSFIYDSKSYLAKYKKLDVPFMGTTRIDIEADAYWGDHLIRAWRIMKDDSNLYWDPIPTAQEYNGLNEDKIMRLMMISPTYLTRDTRVESFNQYYWALGHKSYLRNEGDVMELDPSMYHSSVSYSTNKLEAPAMFFGKRSQELPFVYLKDNSVKFYTSINESVMPSLISSDLPNRSFMLRVEREPLPVIIGEDIYDDVIRLDMYEGGDMVESDITYRESWYLAKGVGLIKIMVKYFDPIAFYGLDDNYGYIQECMHDIDCMSSSISEPHLILTLNKKQEIERLNISISSNGDYECNNDTCVGEFDMNTDNGAYIKSIDNEYTGYVESEDNNGNISKIFYLTDGELFLPKDFLLSMGSDELIYRMRMPIPSEVFPSEQRQEALSPWSNTAILRIIK